MKKILEIGTGCGYQAAILAKIANEVYSVERIKSLHELARRNLRSLRIANLRLHYGDGMLGLPQVALLTVLSSLRQVSRFLMPYWINWR